ncbi:MAG TPA: hypothetical protein VGL23_04360 [Chloroflexota bacterium]|jgi:hypothetical protein
MEDPGAFYSVALPNPDLRRVLVAEARQRPGRWRFGWSADGGQIVRRAVAAVLRAGAARLEPESRPAFAETAGVRA